MNVEQVERIFRAVNCDNRLNLLAERYAIRKLEQEPSTHDIDGVSYIRVNSTIQAPIMQAVEDFLKRGMDDRAATCRKQAAALEAALSVMVSKTGIRETEFNHFASCMAHNWQGGSGAQQAKQALWAMQEMAASFRLEADTYEQAHINNTFFYCLGRRFKGASLPLPSATEACKAYSCVIEAIRKESPALLDGMKTDYDATGERGSEIRRLMQSGYNVGG